ncbi:hypothetical protein TTHERM_00519830 (macronuclear) [Tetrahymena thermophila SB210]|uniref:Uncharacterized protein n=1 Tax=Tetrahymena thermophila (strain SB210) TaxID=312017 RepID=I7ME67_TETTS|nr:hypothetical protein TTHERM_00519830 [Tetrahymena thermophila SB210]EAR95052.2 hypothetical protein TTHERM_00519830 [Tetrahymena thermophila SB210]|eukprot:XP_001015297.2 hypothetical protein TTHERM_00519830 [Tetrahymena thermophila SB210]
MIKSQELGFYCQKHKQNDIVYIKINNIQDDEDIFYCRQCPLSNTNISMLDCADIKQIIDWSQECYIINFFPFNNDANFLKQVKKTLSQNANRSLGKKIDQFYDQLQRILVGIVTDAKKKAHNLAEKLRSLENKSANIYSEIVQIKEIKNVVLNQNINQNQKEKKMRDLLKQINQNKQKNTEKFSCIIEEQQQLQTELQQTQLSVYTNQLQNLINNQNSFQKEYQELFPPSYIDLIPNLEFERIPQQIHNLPFLDQNQVMNRSNNQIEFIILNQSQLQQFQMKRILNKKSQYFLKFKLRNNPYFLISNVHSNIQTNYTQHINPQDFYINNFLIELFSNNNENDLFSLNCNLTGCFQNSQNQINLNPQPINQQNLNFNPIIQNNNLQIKNLNQVPDHLNGQYFQNYDYNLQYQNFQEQNTAQLPDQGQNNFQNNMQNQNVNNFNQQQQNITYQPNLNQQNNISNIQNQNFNNLSNYQQIFSQIPNQHLNDYSNNLQNQYINNNQQYKNSTYLPSLNENNQVNNIQNNNHQQQSVAPLNQLNQNNYQNQFQNFNFNNLNQQQTNVLQQHNNQQNNNKNDTQNLNFNNCNFQNQNDASYLNQYQNNYLQQNIESQIQQEQQTLDDNIIKLNSLNFEKEINQQQPYQGLYNYENNVQNQQVSINVPQKNNKNNDQQLTFNLMKINENSNAVDNNKVINDNNLFKYNQENIAQNQQNFIQQKKLNLPQKYQPACNNNNQSQKEIEIIVQIQISEGIFQASYFTDQKQLIQLPQKLLKNLAQSQNLQLKITLNGQQQLILSQAIEQVDSQNI